MNKYVISLFGEKYFGMLACLVNSIYRVNANANVQIFYQDIGLEKINLLKNTWSKIELEKTFFTISTDPVQRVSIKAMTWTDMVERNLGNNLCLLDVDTLVIQDVFHFFNEENFDLIFTEKDGNSPTINNGVMLSKASPKIAGLFKKWELETFKIFNDPKLIKEALDPKNNFLACDQMALYKILGYEKNKTEYLIDGLKIIAKPCSVLNEMRPSPITPQRHILHYKSRWQRMLIDGLNFSKMRPKKTSWEMYIFYLKNCLEAINALNKANKTKLQPQDINIVFPFYINKKLKENIFIYPFYFLKSHFIRSFKYLKKSIIK